MTMLQTSEQEYDGDALRLSVFFVMRGVCLVSLSRTSWKRVCSCWRGVGSRWPNGETRWSCPAWFLLWWGSFTRHAFI